MRAIAKSPRYQGGWLDKVEALCYSALRLDNLSRAQAQAVRVARAELGDDVGVLGATAVALAQIG